MILLHHTTELWPPWLVCQSIALHLWPALSKFQIFGFSCPESPVVYAHVHFNVFLGGFMLNPFKDFPFCSYECHITSWSAHEQIKLMVLDLWGTFTVEGKDLLSKMLKGLMVVYQITLTSQLRKDVFFNLGDGVLQGSLVGCLSPMLFIIQRFSKQNENLHHRKVTIGCLSLCWHLRYEQDRASWRGLGGIVLLQYLLS